MDNAMPAWGERGAVRRFPFSPGVYVGIVVDDGVREFTIVGLI